MKRNRLKRLTILYVEDERKLAGLMEQAIGSVFGTFLMAHDGREGWEAFKEYRPDLVITDITMPQMDGLSLAEKIREHSPAVPVVVLSAYSDKEKLLGAIESGIRKYFIKPFDPDEFLEYLEELAEREGLDTREPLSEEFHFDRRERWLYRGKERIRLTRREIALLEALLEEPNRLLDRETIKSLLWPNQEITDDALRIFIKRLRDKTSKDLIRTESGFGYALASF